MSNTNTNTNNNTNAAASNANTTNVTKGEYFGAFAGGMAHGTSWTLKLTASLVRLAENLTVKGIGMAADAVLKEEFVSNSRKGYHAGVDSVDTLLNTVDTAAITMDIEKLSKIEVF